MNLIYLCVFYQKSYINLLKLLITSISVKANINKETTHILIITSPEFQTQIQNDLKEFDLPLHYYILELYSLFDAGCARLNIFKYENITKYDKILYLDTDILLNSDVNVLFNLEISNKKIYALEEGIIGDIWHGKEFFDFTKYNINESAFTSGILLFSNSDCIKSLFDTIQLHITDYIYIKKNKIPCCLDQGFIIYNAMVQNKYDKQLLKKYVENNPSSVSSEKIIYHFPGGPGAYDSKFSKMIHFLEVMNISYNNVDKLNTISLENKKYSWGDNSIQFLKNGKMKAFGKGTYTQKNIYTFEAKFGGKIHSLVFNNNYTEFTSTRNGDKNIVKGELL